MVLLFSNNRTIRNKTLHSNVRYPSRSPSNFASAPYQTPTPQASILQYSPITFYALPFHPEQIPKISSKPTDHKKNINSILYKHLPPKSKTVKEKGEKYRTEPILSIINHPSQTCVSHNQKTSFLFTFLREREKIASQLVILPFFHPLPRKRKPQSQKWRLIWAECPGKNPFLMRFVFFAKPDTYTCSM